MTKFSQTLIWATLALVLSACGGQAADKSLTAVLASSPPMADVQIGGVVDRITADPGTGHITIEGWHMLTPRTKQQMLNVYAPGARSVVSVERMDRPDVAAAVNDKDLAMAGFRLVLAAEPGTQLSELCISYDDRHYGKRFAYAAPEEPVKCPVGGL